MQRPAVFHDKLIHDAAILKFRRHDLPSIGLHFQVAAKGWICLEPVESAKEVVDRVAEVFDYGCMEGNMKMNPPFFGVEFAEDMVPAFGDVRMVRCITGGSESEIEILEADDSSMSIPDNDLVQVDIVGKFGQGRSRFESRRHLEGIAEVKLADANLMRLHFLEGLGGIFIFHREMAGVVVDAQMLPDASVKVMLTGQGVEEPDGFRRGLQKAERLGFQSQMHHVPGFLRHPGDVFHAMPQVVAHRLLLLRTVDEFLERARDGADASFDTFGQKLGQDIEETVGVGKTFRSRPVRRINLFLYAASVKLAVWKSIDRKNVTVVLVEPLTKGGQGGGFHQFERRPVAEAKPDGIRKARRDAFPDGERVLLKRLKDLKPAFASVNVRAIGEMNPVVQLHRMTIV